jgi:predicted metalloprotease with PDZ domain
MSMPHRQVVFSSRFWFVFLFGLPGLGSVPAVLADSGPTLEIEIDARDLPRRLLHSRIQIPCEPGKLKLWYPKWVPGTHGPYGPVQNVGGLRVQTTSGKPLMWLRDEMEPYRIECDVPDGVREITVMLDTICNEAAEHAAGYLSYGNRLVGMINWGTCLIYPEGPPCDEIQVNLSLRLPARWKFATALANNGDNGGLFKFKKLSLTELVDCPLIAGEHLKSIPLSTGTDPPAVLDVVSESPAALEISPRIIELYSRVAREAGALFGNCHYKNFHFLVICSDDLGYLGLEHLTSSINGVGERDLIEDGRRTGWVANLIPHEYVHSWCGKFRRPAGMCTPNFHTPQKTKLLWVYEGLAEYLGEILMVRSGLIDGTAYREGLAATIRSLSHKEGRRWRSLEDTGVVSYMLRAGSPNWGGLRRDQDYYFEGMLIWLEADAIIREKSKGQKSLDDFCRKFLGAGSSTANVLPYELPEIVKDLSELADFDWQPFLEKRVSQPLDALPLEVVSRCGYRIEYSNRAPSEPMGRRNRSGTSGVTALDSIGLAFSSDGTVSDIVPGMTGDKAGFGPGMKVIGVNNKTFSRQRLLDALDRSVTSHKIDFLLVDGEDFRTIALNYSGGPRYLELVRDTSKPDVLAEILKPRANGPEAKPPAALPVKPPTIAAPASADAATSSAIPAPRGYVCQRAEIPIKVDGRLDDEAWKAAPWTDAFVDIEGGRRSPPRFNTRAKMVWDDDYFYVGALLEEPHVWGTLKAHDSVIFKDNDFELFIDPDGDNHEYYEIEINALNTVWDLLLKKPYRDGGPAINEWEIPGLKTAVHVEGTLNDPTNIDQTWSVELAIPWKALAEFSHRPAPPKDGDQWRINFSRVQWQHQIQDGKYGKVSNSTEDNWVWTPQGAVDMHRPERWGYVQFSTIAGARATYRPDPAAIVRDRLMQIYQAEKMFFEKNDRWTGSITDLKLADLPGLPEHTTRLELTREGFEAAISTRRRGKRPETWTIRQDSRLQSSQIKSPDSTPQSRPE